jgi:hypothetical protein
MGCASVEFVGEDCYVARVLWGCGGVPGCGAGVVGCAAESS